MRGPYEGAGIGGGKSVVIVVPRLPTRRPFERTGIDRGKLAGVVVPRWPTRRLFERTGIGRGKSVGPGQFNPPEWCHHQLMMMIHR